MEQDWTRIEGMIIGWDTDPALVATAPREQAVFAQLEWFPSSLQLLGVNVTPADGHVVLVKDKKVASGPTSEELAETPTALFEYGARIGSVTTDYLLEGESSLSDNWDEDDLDAEEPSSRIAEIGRTLASSVPLLTALEGIDLVSVEPAEGRRVLLAELPPERAGWDFGDLPLAAPSRQDEEFQVFLATDDHLEHAITHNWGMRTLLIADAHESAGELDQEILDFVSNRPDLEAIAKVTSGADLDIFIESITSFGEDAVRRVIRALGLPTGLADFLLGALPASEVEGAEVYSARGVSNAIGRSMDIVLSDPESRAQPLRSTYQSVAVEKPGSVRAPTSAETIVGTALLTLAARGEASCSRWLKCGGFIGALLFMDSVAEVSLSSYLRRRHQDKEWKNERTRDARCCEEREASSASVGGSPYGGDPSILLPEKSWDSVRQTKKFGVAKLFGV